MLHTSLYEALTSIVVDYLITLISALLRLRQSTNIKQDVLLCKNIILPRMKTSLGQLSLKSMLV